MVLIAKKQRTQQAQIYGCRVRFFLPPYVTQLNLDFKDIDINP